MSRVEEEGGSLGLYCSLADLLDAAVAKGVPIPIFCLARGSVVFAAQLSKVVDYSTEGVLCRKVPLEVKVDKVLPLG